MQEIKLTKIKEVWNHTGFQKYFRNMGWLFFVKIISLFTSLFVSIYTARVFGPTDYGTLTFVVAFVSIIGSFFLSIDQIVIKKINNNPEDADKIIGSTLILKIINSILIIISSTIAALFFANSRVSIILIFVFSIFNFFQSFNSVIDSYFQANANIKKLSIIAVFCFIFSSIIQILILYYNLGILVFLASYSLSHLISSISYIILYKKVNKKISWKIDPIILKDIILISWPFTLSAIATTIYTKIDQIFIKTIINSEQLGIYIVAVRFSEVWFFVSSTICIALLPAILNSEKTDKKIFYTRMKRMYSLLFYSAICICFFMYMISPILIKTLYGNEYHQSIEILRVYVWSIIGYFLITGIQQFLFAENKFKTILLLNLTGMCSSLLFNYLLINKYGILGAAYANIISYSIPLITLLFIKELKEHKKSLINGILKPLKFYE